MLKEFFKPKTVKEAGELKEKFQNALFIAGGTEINSRGDINPEYLISLENLELSTIEEKENTLIIGAMVTMQDLIDNEVLQTSQMTVIGDAAKQIVNYNVRNMATIGGNIHTNKSCSSIIPILVVLQAKLEVIENNQVKNVSIEEYVNNENKNLITKIIIEKPKNNFYAHIRNFKRSANDIAIINIAVGGEIQDNISHVVIAVGGTSMHVRRLESVEKEVEGLKKEEYKAAEIEALVKDSITPIDDLRGSAEFKKQITGALVAMSLQACIAKGN